jgi:hypothetical protein
MGTLAAQTALHGSERGALARGELGDGLGGAGGRMLHLGAHQLEQSVQVHAGLCITSPGWWLLGITLGPLPYRSALLAARLGSGLCFTLFLSAPLR